MASVNAQDLPPQLQLVQGLRHRGYHDLALTYLEKLQSQQTTLSPEVKAALPLELSRSRADIAATMSTGSERDKLLNTSRAELEAFLKTNPPPGLAGEAQQALGNAVAEQARSLAAGLDRAGINASPPAKVAVEMQKAALARFDEADRIFATLQKQQEDLLGIKPAPEKAPSKTLTAATSRSSPLYLSTLYYRALARYDKSRIAGLGIRDSGLANDEARQLAEKLATYRGISSAGWQGFALYARTLEGADDNRANQIYRNIDQANSPNAIIAQRAVRYFPLARADASGDITERSQERDRYRTMAERWLQLYSTSAGNSRDAQHVRYMLIRIYAKELEETPENRRQTAEAQAKLDRALHLIDEMDNGRSDHQEALERMKFSMLRVSGRAKGPVESLKTFDEALLRASLEFHNQQVLEAKLKEVGQAPARKDVEAQFNQQVAVTLTALRRAQDLMRESNLSEKNRVRVWNMLQSCLRRTNDGPRAALICEHLANTARQPDVAQAAAVEAMRLYQFLSRQGNTVDATATQRLLAMAHMLDQRFPDSPQADEARSILGRDLISKKQYDAAIDMLGRVKVNPGTARYLSGLAAWTKHRDVTQGKIVQKSPEADRALKLLQESVAAFAQQKSKDALEQRTEVQAMLLILGIQDTFGDFQSVITSSQPLLKCIEDKAMPDGITPGTELQVMETVMNAYLQLRQTQQGATRLLAIISKRQKDPAWRDSTRFLQATASRLQAQMEEYQKQGEKAKTQYDSTRDGFKQFLEIIATHPQLPLQQRIWLGQSYSGIGDYARAVKVLSDIKPPAANPASKQENPDDETKLYRQATSLRIGALRQAALSEPDANDRDKALAQVEKEMQQLMKEPWARRSPPLLRDEIMLLQLRGNYSGKAGAIARWDQFRTAVRPHIDKSPAMKDLFTEATYHLAYCLYQESLLLKNPDMQKQAIDRSAGVVVDALQSSLTSPKQAEQYRKLLDDPKHAKLKDAVERLQKPARGNTIPSK
ncbi:MAG: hypothetical protein JNJ77_17090 [Planctomycetia bacterium]|nr:hypothetical protein [Planctomycetia bacterium]